MIKLHFIFTTAWAVKCLGYGNLFGNEQLLVSADLSTVLSTDLFQDKIEWESMDAMKYVYIEM